MNRETESSAPTDDMFEAAALWASKMAAADSQAANESAFRQWLQQDQRHGKAYQRMQEILQLTDGMPLPADLQVAANSPPHRGRMGWAVPALAAGLAAIAVAIVQFYPLTSQTIITRPGEVRTVSAGDGSRIHLRGNSSIEIDYGFRARNVRINRGEVSFDVAHEALREFVVESDALRVLAVGTVFNVQAYEDLASVTLVEGRVAVSDRRALLTEPGGTGDAVTLTAGEQVRLDPDRGMLLIRDADVAQVTAWQEDRIYLRDRPLSELIAELNRSFPVRIRIEDPDIANMDVNVSMRINDQETTLRRLERQLPISFSAPVANVITVQSKKAAGQATP